MGNTGGTGGVNGGGGGGGGGIRGGGGGGGGGGWGGGGGGGGGGGWFGGYGEKCDPAMIDSALKDSDDTIFVWLKDDVDAQSFIDFAERAGTIKTDKETAHRMAEMRKTNNKDRTKECIVTYEQKEDVKKAFKILEELQSNGQVIKVLPAKDYIKMEDIKDCYRPGEKIAWCFWRLQTDKHHLKGGGGGRGGGFWQYRGQDGEPGGPGGQGGRGGKGGGCY